MKSKNMRIIFSMLIMAVLALSLFSLSASAAQTDAQTDSTSAQTVQTDEQELTLLKGDFQITGKTIAIAVGVSILATGITVFLIWHGYKTNGQSEHYTYKKNAPLTITNSEDVHVDTIVNRRKIERNNNR